VIAKVLSDPLRVRGVALVASINGENTDTNGLERTKTDCSSGESLGNPWNSSRTSFKGDESFLFDAEARRTQRGAEDHFD
jgi:hypothetical protein